MIVDFGPFHFLHFQLFQTTIWLLPFKLTASCVPDKLLQYVGYQDLFSLYFLYSELYSHFNFIQLVICLAF